MTDLATLNSTIDGQNLDFFAGVPMVFHCHHFNLFLDQTVDDALGEKRGAEVRFKASRAAARTLLSNLFETADAQTPAEKLELARTLFGAIGHGTLDFDAGPEGGTAKGSFLHYGFAWRDKYGGQARRFHTADAFAAGWAAAAIELAHELEPLSMEASEHECVATRQAHCVFSLTKSDAEAVRPPVDASATQAVIGPPLEGLHEERISAIDKGLRDFLSGVAGDERGLVQAFGVFVTRHLTDYYNRITYETYFELKKRSDAMANIGAELFVESGHVCVFNTFGGILYSPEWDGLVGRIQGDLEEVVSSCLAIARALGFGKWTIKELTPDRFVLATSSEYESPYVRTHYGETAEPLGFFMKGAATGIMRLWDAIDWQNRPALDNTLYQTLFRAGAAKWSFEQRSSLMNGDACDEFVVTRVGKQT